MATVPITFNGPQARNGERSRSCDTGVLRSVSEEPTFKLPICYTENALE